MGYTSHRQYLFIFDQDQFLPIFNRNNVMSTHYLVVRSNCGVAISVIIYTDLNDSSWTAFCFNNKWHKTVTHVRWMAHKIYIILFSITVKVALSESGRLTVIYIVVIKNDDFIIHIIPTCRERYPPCASDSFRTNNNRYFQVW